VSAGSVGRVRPERIRENFFAAAVMNGVPADSTG
jgi:hypothetical protein